MTQTARTGKWFGTLYGDTPCVVAARRVLRRHLRAVDRMLILTTAETEGGAEPVHQLRVAVRRSEAALGVFKAYCDPKRLKRHRKRLRRLRRAAAALRQNDVHRSVLQDSLAGSEPTERHVVEIALERLLRARSGIHDDLTQLRERHPRLSGPKRMHRLLRPGLNTGVQGPGVHKWSGSPAPPFTLATLASSVLPKVLEAVSQKRTEDLRDPLKLHGLRIAGKKLRYALEIFAGCFPAALKEEHYPGIVAMLDRLGEINDLLELAEWIENLPRPLKEREDTNNNGAMAPAEEEEEEAFVRVAQGYRTTYERRYEEFLGWWQSKEALKLFDGLADCVRRHARQPAALRAPSWRPGRMVNEARRESPSGEFPSFSAAATPIHRRVAAIDIGTNSLRLVVGEADALTHFRVIEELKETTRLGSGVFRDGRMTQDAMDMSVLAMVRMKAVAEGCHVERIRAVATSAVREAANRANFVEMIERQAGIQVEVIDAEREARLAFSSVANSFDMDDRRVAVADIGGGSTELVLSSGGVIDAIHPLPLGAVRLTELFDGRDNGKSSFDDMRRAVDCVIQDRLRGCAYQPFLIMGTGGTFTSLARVAIRHGFSGDGGGRFPFAVRGYELRHGDVLHHLDALRRMPLEERRKIPGLSTQRAEIIVAGVCIVERLMAFFGVERVRVHDGGIRDGLLTEMIDDLGVPAEPPRRPVAGSLEVVRRFAERIRYDRLHSEHVGFLALRIFDQLVQQYDASIGTWGRQEARFLLHAAAILHDVGIAVAWPRHHKHSYEMVVHADLPGFTRRDVEVIANICRYHRRKGPTTKHAHFQRLGDDDQRLVRHLVGILRIADGLDRLHEQEVTDLTVSPSPKSILFDVTAVDNPKSNIRYAKRKADVFEATFHTQAKFTWTRSTTACGPNSESNASFVESVLPA